MGNPGRRDDGLGPAFIAQLETRRLPGLTLEADYQLQVEDALLFSEHQTVIVVDALKTGDKPFLFQKIAPARNFSFTSHSLSPEAVAYLCLELYQKRPDVMTLAIRGYEFEVGEGLSPAARNNLEAALDFLVKKLIPTRAEERASAIMNKPSRLKSKRNSHGKKKKRSPGN
ncbi:MAG: hydrogenase maturation protease [Candidatus Saccharicenans sp.]|nr:hydrogenase maturation protease [Candidatus Saccharicenans sp.]